MRGAPRHARKPWSPPLALSLQQRHLVNNSNNVRARREQARNGWFVGTVALCSGLVAIVASTLVEAASERDAYQRFSRDVRSTMACLAAEPSAEPVEATATAERTASRCALHAMSLVDAVRNPAIQRERERVHSLASSVRVALDEAPVNERRAMESLRELEPLARP